MLCQVDNSPILTVAGSTLGGAMTRTRAQREAAAYHEAGHAIAAHTQHVAIHNISIVPSEDTLGFVHHAPMMRRFNPKYANSARMCIRVERLLRISLAGQVAQRKFKPHSVRHGHSINDDLASCLMFLYLAKPDTPQWTANVRRLAIETRLLVDRNWGLIGALATELLARGKLTGKQAEAVIRQWYDSDFKNRRGKSAGSP